MEWVKDENRKLILKALNRESLTFGELLEMNIVSRTSLSSHLRKLMKSEDIQKTYATEKKRVVVYQICSKAVADLKIEGMIHYLGLVATHQVARTELNRPIEFDINEEMKGYVEAKPEDVSWKELFEVLKEKYPLTI